MKKLLFLILPAFLPLIISCQENSLFFITEDYTNYYLLELDLKEEKYIFSKHSAKRIQIDKGYFIKKGTTIELKSETRYFSFNPYLHKKIYLKNDKLYMNKAEMLIGNNGINNTPIKDLGLDYKFENLDEFVSEKRIKVERKSESMKQFKGKEFEENLKEIMKLRVPEYLPLIEKHYLGPEDYTHYIDDNRVDWDQDISGVAVIDMFSTVVHESTHLANDTNKILLYPDSLIELKRTEVISTKSMSEFFEKRCTTDSIFRYNTYIKDAEDKMASNIAGIYGLMNEFCAYYHGSRVAYLMYKKYEELSGDFEYFKDFMAADVSGTFYAYYEFNLFMGGYLAYLKLNQPTIYQATINNQSLCIAYTLIDSAFKDVVGKVESELSDTKYYQYHYNKYGKFAKQDLQQFLPDLEVLKKQMIVNK
jgi:hypothetical protein